MRTRRLRTHEGLLRSSLARARDPEVRSRLGAIVERIDGWKASAKRLRELRGPLEAYRRTLPADDAAGRMIDAALPRLRD